MRLARLARVPGLNNLIGQFEGCMGPANGFSREGNFFSTKGLAMGLCRACSVRRTLTNNGFTNNKGRRKPALAAVGRPVARLFESGRHLGNVMAVDRSNNIPAIGLKTLLGVVAKPAFNIAINRNGIIVVQGNKFRQTPDPCKCAGFVADTFHKAAIA